MPAPIPVPIRQAIWARWKDRQSSSVIADQLKLNPRTVRKLIQQFRTKGEAALQPGYSSPPQDQRYQTVRKHVEQLRREHPTWGAGFLCAQLYEANQQLPEEQRWAIPAQRTMERWFRQAGLGPAPPGCRPRGDCRRAVRSHEVWQMDAAEKIPLASGERVSWLRITDECSGAVLETRVFPPPELDSGACRGDAVGPPSGVCEVGPTPANPR